MTRDPYVWIDPWALRDDYQAAFDQESDYHREAMTRMAEAHYAAGARFQAQNDHLMRQITDTAAMDPLAGMPFVRTKP
jgi:hypothetical protein